MNDIHRTPYDPDVWIREAIAAWKNHNEESDYDPLLKSSAASLLAIAITLQDVRTAPIFKAMLG